ncbi:MAG: NAD(P)/FAD-dependent oxidoreductase [Lentisphaerae bacterium]|nr:NAD(P)/FAD-dependent oxidoreductase [Lentisphaerota bacterium]
MKYDYDIITIGLGPAGMAVAIMGSEMGLKVCAIEKNKIGGECMNVGCIPSKSLLRMAQARHVAGNLGSMELEGAGQPAVLDPFGRVRNYVKYINEKKTLGMFKKVELVLGQGDASFVDAHTVEAGGKRYTARRIFIAAGTHPMVPPIEGLGDVECLTNETLFDLESVPASMVVLGGGAIGCEMAQAFSRLGCKCSIIHMDPYLLPAGEEDVGELLRERFEQEGIQVLNGRKIVRVEKAGEVVRVHSDRGEVLEGEKLLVAAGRRIDLSALNLEAAGVELTPRGAVKVNRHLQTTKGNIYGVGDCNGHFLLTHAAMHQGMIALMNSMMPAPFRKDFRKFVVPWTVFTDPQVSHVGKHASELDRRGIRYETIESKYEDYGAAIAEGVGIGFIKVYASKAGRIYGARIVGEGSGEMINEWALAIQKRVRLHDIMMLQHSFPTMSFLTKRIAETWMMKRMESPFLKNLCRFMFRM